MQTQQGDEQPFKQLSEKETIRYFFPRKTPAWTWIVVLIGIFIGATGGLMHLPIITGLGAIPCGIGIGIIIRVKKANPTDEQYDQWIENQAEDIYFRGLQMHNLDENDLIDSFCIRSIVLPGSTVSSDYPEDEVYIKQGRDGQWRGSVIVYTYIFLTRNFVAVFENDSNAFYHHGTFEKNEMYTYQDIVNATTDTRRDAILIEGRWYSYRVEQFCLKNFHNMSIPFGAIVKATLLERNSYAPGLLRVDGRFDRTLNRLRQQLLFIRRQH